jgi:CheY-like chemotaxis protein
MIASQSRVLRLAPFPPHFLPIADVQMPGMPRFELHQCLSAFGKPIPTILITAYPDDAVRERALSAGLIGYLSKPLRRMICSPHPLGSDTRP